MHSTLAELMHDCFEKHRQGKAVFTDGTEARKSLEVVLAAYEPVSDLIEVRVPFRQWQSGEFKHAPPP